MPQANASVGVIGGSGLYDIESLTDLTEVKPETPFGPPSDSIVIGTLSGIRVAFLPRHGRGHRLSPTEIPFRANIFALKSLGVKHVIAINSVGSFKETIKPGHLLIPDQLIDRTCHRVSTFFEGGIVAHIGFAEPFCTGTRKVLHDCAREVGATVHHGGTYVVMEGPAFSTRAESRLHRSWGADVIGMTALPEAKLAREAEMCYAIIACSTDYDSWHQDEKPVTVDMIISTLNANMTLAKRILSLAVTRLPDNAACECSHALENAIITDPKAIPQPLKSRLNLLIGRYIK